MTERAATMVETSGSDSRTVRPDTSVNSASPAEAGLEHIIQHGNRGHYRSRPYQRGPNWFKTGDGSKISVIAGWGTYCSPRPDWPTEWGGAPEDYPGPFTAVEAWLTDDPDPQSIGVDELRAWIADHGGLVAGPAETEGDLP